MKKLKIGIIGCGGVARQKHLPVLSKLGEKCEVIGFCDTIRERAEAMAKEFGSSSAKVYTDFKKLIAETSIDIVYVLTPNVSHSPIAIAAFEAGKHVHCEKPMAHTAMEAQKMLDAWKKSGKKFTIGYQSRFRTEVQALKKACELGELGEIYYAKAHAIRRRAVPTWGVFPDKALQGGGPLIDIGTHALDMTLWLMDNYEPLSVSGSVFYKLGNLPNAVEGNMFGPWDPKTYEVEDSAFALIKMKNGAAIYLEASWAINLLDSREAATTLCGTKAGAEIRSGMSYPVSELIYNTSRHGQLTEEKLSSGGNIAYFKGILGEPEYLEAESWLDSIIKDTEPLVKPEEAFIVTQILECIYKSAESGKEVFI
ncbi:MAG: Gfo/Idh/MocA family oxidoreductase [Treponema sp.]|nr:Gfo/Idh/MocA family oxidoreductase [Treponema sp.]